MVEPTFWVNLKPDRCVSVEDRSFTYGDGLFETLCVYDGRALLLDLHLARLERGCARLQLDYPEARVREQLALCLQRASLLQLEDACIRLTLTRGAGDRGYAPGSAPVLLSAALYELDGSWRGHLVVETAIVCKTELAIQPRLAGIKHNNRLEQVLAASEVQRSEHALGVMCDTEGAPTAFVNGNLLIRSDDAWLTPPLERCGIHGCVRQWLLDEGAVYGFPVVQRPLTRADLLAAQELIVTNSLMGVRAVASLVDTQSGTEESCYTQVEAARLHRTFLQAMGADS